MKRDSVKTTASEKLSRKCLKKFLFYFRNGYADPKYITWERGYKWNAHLAFCEQLNKQEFKKLIAKKEYRAVADIATRIESKTNLLFSFEKMALRDAVKTPQGAKLFATGLYEYVYGTATLKDRFEKFVEVVGCLPRSQTRVLTWPLVTVFGFLANPKEHIFLKPRVTQRAAAAYGFPFQYSSKPNWNTYDSLLAFARAIKNDTKSYHPKDYMDLQSFIWVMGSDEYPD